MRSSSRQILAVVSTALVLSGCDARTRNEAVPTVEDRPGESLAVLPTFQAATNEQRNLLERARTELLQDRQEAAMTTLSDLVQTETLSRELRDGIVLYGDLLDESGQTADAIAFLEAASRELPPDGDVYFVLGRIYASEGLVEEGEEAFRHAVRADPSLLRAWVALARLLDASGRPDAAEEAMIHYEREVFRLGAELSGPGTIEDKLETIATLRVALPDPRVSRLLARALQSDALEVQRAALDALANVGTRNALDALDAYLAREPDPGLAERARVVREAISARER